MKKIEISEGFLRNIHYFCIMKQNICLFKQFLVCFAMLLGFFLPISASEQNDSLSNDPMQNVSISLLTCEPHDEVYSLYGHTAIRLTNSKTGEDWAINYGVFDFSSDFFVLRFVFGLTDYTIGIYPFERFLSEYRYFGCAVHQQRINMDSQQKREFIRLLDENIRPENAIYRYNYFYNNCTTKAMDIIHHAIQNGESRQIVQWPDHDSTESTTTFRMLIHSKNEDHPWARFGNDLLLGIGSDQPTRNYERWFLPEIMMRDFNEAKIVTSDNGKCTSRSLVDSTFVVIEAGTPYSSATSDFPFRPMTCAIMYLVLVIAFCLSERYWLKRTLKWGRFTLTLPYTVIGIVLTAMIFSQHPTVSLNLQILIANPFIAILTLPNIKWRWKWHYVIVMCILFFIGGFFQSYAEGMMLMGISLVMLAASAIIKQTS